MAKRLVNYFANIRSDEAFDNFLLQNALIILDVYQEIYGPCASSLHATIEKAKLSLLDSDMIQVAICDAGKIEKLKRFRFKSKPTIVFCNKEKVIDVLYHANIPLLKARIQIHFEAHENDIEQEYYEFDQPLPFEQIELDRIKEEQDEVERIRKETEDKELKQELDEVIKLMAEFSNEYGITLFMPHVLDSALKKTLDFSQRLLLNSRARKTVQITQDMMKKLNYKLENPIDDEIINYLYDKELLIVMWSGDDRKPIEDQLAMFVKDVSEPLSIEGEDVEDQSSNDLQTTILEPLIVYLDDDKDDESKDSTFDEKSHHESEKRKTKETLIDDTTDTSSSLRISQNTQRLSDQRDSMMSEERIHKKLVIPPVWTPANQAGNFMFMFTFFRTQFEHFLPPIKEPEPPHICMVFSVSDRSSVFEICKNFPKQLLASGFFSSDDFNECKLICKTVEKYDELTEKSIVEDKIIMKVARQTSGFELALSGVGPIYVSQNTSKGAEECSKVFNQSFFEAEDVLNSEETKN